MKSTDLKNNSNTFSHYQPGILFSNAASEWFIHNQIRWKDATKLKYENVLNKQILPVFGNLLVSQITEGGIQAFLNSKLEEGLSASSINMLLLLIQGILSYCAEQGYREKLKMTIVKPTLQKKKLTIIFLKKQMLM